MNFLIKIIVVLHCLVGTVCPMYKIIPQWKDNKPHAFLVYEQGFQQFGKEITPLERIIRIKLELDYNANSVQVTDFDALGVQHVLKLDASQSVCIESSMGDIQVQTSVEQKEKLLGVLRAYQEWKQSLEMPKLQSKL